MDPITIALLASAVGSGAGILGSHIGKKKGERAEEKKTERRAKESKRETKAGLKQDALNRRIASMENERKLRTHTAKRKAQSMHDTADIVREALNI